MILMVYSVGSHLLFIVLFPLQPTLYKNNISLQSPEQNNNAIVKIGCKAENINYLLTVTNVEPIL